MIYTHPCYLHIFIFIIATGNRRNRWSMVTIRLALAVYTRSPAAYDALKSFDLIQLPSRATLQAYTGAFRDEAGSFQAVIDNAFFTKLLCLLHP